VAEPPELTDAPWEEDYADAAYFTEEVRRYLFDALGGELVLEGGLVVETTLDLDLQKAAVRAVRTGLRDLDRRQGFRGMLRHVDEDEIPAEIERIAVENGLAPPDDAEAEAEAKTDAELADEEVAAAVVEALAEIAAETGDVEAEPVDEATRVRALLPEDEDEPVLGVVTAVDAKAQLAHVAFAPDASAVVRLEDVDWARKADTGVRGGPVKKIGRIFRVGDVARFELLPPPEDLPPEDSPAHGQLLVGLHQEPVVEGALLSLEVSTGDVIALVGGNDFAKSEFDRVTQARRQPGSAFKPMIYGAALSVVDENGHHLYTPASIVHDRPKVYEDRTTGFVWRPENYGRKFYGPITLRKALAKSVNNAAVHMADQVGVGRVIAYARQLGIRSPLERSLALALGASGVSLLELTRTYAVFPNGGRRVVPHFIRRVLDREGNVLMEHVPLGDPLEPQPEEGEQEDVQVAAERPGEALPSDDAAPEPPGDPDQLIPPEEAYLMADMLKAVVKEGTGWRLKRLGRPLGGKTGTTNDQADAWFVGFSPDIATGVWVGHDVSHFLGWGETGSRAAAPIWVDYMRVALEGRPRRDFAAPDDIVFTRIDRETGLLASRHTEEVVFQPFIAGTEPTETADTWHNTQDARDDLRSDTFEEPDHEMRLMQLDSF
jgi:penicillin-binding protein 1A